MQGDGAALLTYRIKDIAKIDLSRFRRPAPSAHIPLVKQCAWYLVSAMFFEGRVLSLIPSAAKRRILSAFGSQIGAGFVCKPRVKIKSPWYFKCGSHVWLGEAVWIDNHCDVVLGSNVCVSQGVYLGTGNHDWSDLEFAFFCRPIVIGSSVWITAFRRLRPGTVIEDNTVVLDGL